MLNVILPCAGKGTRLGLPYSKEIHKVSSDYALIDFSLNLCLKNKKYVNEIVFVTEPHKKDLIKYLDKWKKNFKIRICYFNKKYSEWAGSILSAEKKFYKKNLVLLPDTIIDDPKNQIFKKTLDILELNDVSFAIKKEKKAKFLKNLGAIRSKGTNVLSFCDKPSKNLKSYNAFWCSFGFTKYSGKLLLEMMMRSINREKVSLNEELLKAQCFYIKDYLDLGTWENLRSKKLNKYV